MRASLIAPAVAAASLFTMNSAFAADLNLLCKSELMQANGATTDFARQYEITFATSEVTVYDNNGQGFVKQFTTTYQQADKNFIVIVHNNDKYHVINRVMGMAFSINNLGERRRGICSPITTATQQPANQS
jgi:hypothetical protein